MTNETDFEDRTVEELMSIMAKIETVVEQKLPSKRQEALEQIKAIVRQYDLSYDEVVEVIRTTTRRGKAPAIYRNPDNNRQTWSGKGEPPAWFVTAKDKEALRIPGP